MIELIVQKLDEYFNILENYKKNPTYILKFVKQRKHYHTVIVPTYQKDETKD
jgi:hypothetical protein